MTVVSFYEWENWGCCWWVAKLCWILWEPHGLQQARLPCPSPSPRICSNSYSLNWRCHPTISSSAVPFYSCPQYFPASGSFLIRCPKLLELQHQSFQWLFRVDFLQVWLVWSPCCPRNSQESSLTPQFKSINSSVLRFLYNPILTSIHDHWKNHSLD